MCHGCVLYIGLCAIQLIQVHFLIQRTHRCSAPVVGLEEHSAHEWQAATPAQRTPVTWWDCYPNGPEGRGSEFVPLKKRKVGSFFLLHKISRTACCFGISTFLKQYSCHESATIWYTDHQYLTQYSEIINNLPEIPLIFCNYAVRWCGMWRKEPGQSPCNVLSISDLELYVTETGTGVCDPVTD